MATAWTVDTRKSRVICVVVPHKFATAQISIIRFIQFVCVFGAIDQWLAAFTPQKTRLLADDLFPSVNFYFVQVNFRLSGIDINGREATMCKALQKGEHYGP